VGRLGNWFNQELYGAPTKLPWGLRLNMTGSAIGHGERCYDGTSCPTGTLFHPTFLYEMIWNLIGAALLLWVGDKLMKRFKAGSLFLLYVMWYTAGRTWIEALRIDYAHEIMGIRVNVWVSVAVFVLAVVAFAVLQRTGSRPVALVERLRTLTEVEIQARNEEESSTQAISKNSLQAVGVNSEDDSEDVQ
jgi:prolipoprotein diacylglyceryl transferase